MGAERVERLAHQPLRGRALVIARADVVDDRVPEDMLLHSRPQCAARRVQ